MNTQARLAIPASPEHKLLVHYYVLDLGVCQVHISHGDADVAVDLVAVLRSLVALCHLHPPLDGKTGVRGKVAVPPTK